MPDKSNGVRKLGWGAVGLGYLLLVAFALSGIARTPFWLMCLAVLSGAAFLTTLLLAGLTRWALRDEVREKQFSLSTLLAAMTLLGLFCAVVRWLVLRHPELPSGDMFFFILFAVVCMAMLACALPGSLFVADAVIWLAIWLLRRRHERRRSDRLRDR
jgi:hypothetical protein